MLVLEKEGLFCEPGGFFLDPLLPVDQAVITHSHSDHARRGARIYFTAEKGVRLLRARLGQKINVRGFPYGEPFQIGPVTVSFHPAGHILGSSQIRLEHRGEVWVVSGDYKREPDPTCDAFEPLKCDVFVTEATFGTPGFRWEKGRVFGREIYEWWKENRTKGKNSLLYAYSLGKTQRILGLIQEFLDRPVYLAPPAFSITEIYRSQGVLLPRTICISSLDSEKKLDGELVIASRGFLNGEFASCLGDSFATAFASGWAARDHDRRMGRIDHAFPLSDHADWDDLLRTIRDTGARRVVVQHRGSGALVRYLRRIGLHAHSVYDLRRKNDQQLTLF